MQIRVPYASLVHAMGVNGSVIADRALQDEMKNAILWVKDGIVSLCSFGINLVNATPLEGAEVTLEPGETPPQFVALKSRDIMGALDSFKSLKRTKVKDTMFTILGDAVTLAVTEEALDPESEGAEQYNQTSRFLIRTSRMQPVVEKELLTLDLNFSGEVYDSGALLVYIQALLPTIAKQVSESHSSMMFGASHVYTVLTSHVCMMENRLPEVFRDFKLSNSMVSFLKSFIETNETFELSRVSGDNGMVILTVKVGSSVSRIKCADMSRAFDIRNFIDLPSNGISVDKVYLLDVLKRLPSGVSTVTLEIELVPQLEGTVGTFKIITPSFKQSVPVRRAKGEGSFRFNIQSDLLLSMIFSHTDMFMDDIFFYLEGVDSGYTILGCTDNTRVWQTKANRLSPARESINW